MSFHRVSRAPGAIRKARLDNLALVPASLLPYKREWQQIANELPQGSTLIILPPTDTKQRKVFEDVAEGLKANGHQVKAVGVETFNTSVDKPTPTLVIQPKLF